LNKKTTFNPALGPFLRGRACTGDPRLSPVAPGGFCVWGPQQRGPPVRDRTMPGSNTFWGRGIFGPRAVTGRNSQRVPPCGGQPPWRPGAWAGPPPPPFQEVVSWITPHKTLVCYPRTGRKPHGHGSPFPETGVFLPGRKHESLGYESGAIPFKNACRSGRKKPHPPRWAAPAAKQGRGKPRPTCQLKKRFEKGTLI